MNLKRDRGMPSFSPTSRRFIQLGLLTSAAVVATVLFAASPVDSNELAKAPDSSPRADRGVISPPAGFTESSIGGAPLALPTYGDVATAPTLTIADVFLDGEPHALILSRMSVFTPNASLTSSGDDGEFALAQPQVALFSGGVAGDDASLAFLSFSPHGTYGFVEFAGRTHVISTGPAGAAWSARVADIAEIPGIGGFTCGTDSLEIVSPETAAPPAEGGIASTAPCRVVDVAIETDHEFTASLFGGDTGAAAAYAATLTGAVSAIYTRDFNVRLQINYLRLWTDPGDPWNQTEMGAQLDEFRNYWNANMTGVYRHLAHYFSGRGLGGGVAWLSVVCHSTYGYALSGNLGGYFPYPLQNNHGSNWDVFVVAHEWGHNFGAPHTHDMTPQIDNCAGGDCSVTPNGTIMSYCHGCSGGMSNIRLEMHQRTVDEAILPHLGSVCDLSGDPLTAGSWLHFDGSNDYVGVPAFGAIAPTGEITIELWAYADQNGRYAFGMNPDNGGSRLRARIPASDGRVYFEFGDSTAGQVSYTPPSSILGSWHHFAFVVSQSGNFMRIYHNGVLGTSKIGMTPYVPGAFEFRLGGRGSGSFFDGRLDDVRVWNVARTATQISANYASTISPGEPGLLAYWRLDEGSGTLAEDSAGSADGTVNGAAFVASYSCDDDTGACCFLDGSCLTVTSAACGYFGGTYQGDATSCEVDGCPSIGACCLTGVGGACEIMYENECVAAGGTFLGSAATCDGTGPFNGSSLRFDGVNDNCQIGNPTVLNFAGPITVEAWIKPATMSGVRNILMHGFRINPNAETGIRINNGYYEVFRWNGAQAGAYFPVPATDIGSWVHIAGTHDGATWRLYRNGVEVAQGPDTVGALVMNSKWAIGSRGNGNERYFDGQIDEARIWSFARSQAQIAAGMFAQPPLNAPGLVGYWPLDDAAGAVATDVINGNNGDVVGAVWTSTTLCGVACDPCDANCDGTINPFDIQPFLDLLGPTPPATCSPCAGDVDGNGTVNPFDINAFLACL